MASDEPATFIKKRSKGVRPSGSSSSLRSLSQSTDGASAGDDDEGSAVIRRKKTPAGNVKDREVKPKSRLSFGGNQDDDDDDSSFAVKRTESPRRLLNTLRTSSSTASLRAELPHSLDQASISAPSTPAKTIYSKEYLSQLKATTLSTPPPLRGAEYDDLTRSKFGAALDDIPSSIPTTAAITEARERRERIRLEGGGSGSDAFISLEVGMVNKGRESRLVREEDELGDGDEDMAEFTGAQETIPLGKKANKEAAERMRSGMVDMIHDAEEDEDDEEAREWEMAQIKRGEQRRDTGSNAASSKRAYKPAPIPDSSTLPSLVGVSSRLNAALASLKASHKMDASALDHFERERAELESQEKELRTEVERLEKKSRFFGDFKVFIEEVAAFLDEKQPLLEKIESTNLAIQKERYDIVARRRYSDDADDVALFTGASVPTAFFLVPLDDLAPPPPQLDSYGRPLPDESAPRSVTRAARRAARVNRAVAHSAGQADDGEWTDDDLDPNDSRDLADALTGLREDLAAVFSDVKADDFRDPNRGVRERFEVWRTRFGEDYANAYGGLALVGVWEFWARVEMALWNPFEIAQLVRTHPGLDAYEWHANLAAYGHAGRASSAGEGDESETVVNGLVTSVVIPRLDKLARETYDPLSRLQTARALALVDEVSYCVERSSPRFETLILAFLSRFQDAVARAQTLIAPHLASIALPSNAFDPSTFEARTAFAQRQVKLVQNALRWRRWARSLRLGAGEGTVGGGSTLDELIVRELVAKVVLPVVEAGWPTGGQGVANQLLGILPKDVVPPALRRRLEGNRDS